MPQTMKAWFSVPGPEGAVFELRETAVPSPGPCQVLVAVRAAGVNRGELIRGAQARSGSSAQPTRAGGEFAGEIAALGDGVTGWKPGDRVMGRTAGSYAAWVAAPERALMRVPDAMGWPESAAIPNVFVTAHDALVTNGAAASGECVMVTAASSGVGTAALQIARYVGASPVLATTRSPAKGAALRALGAREVIDTGDAGWVDAVRRATGGRGVTSSSITSAVRCWPATSRFSPSRDGWSASAAPAPGWGTATSTRSRASDCGSSASRSARARRRSRSSAASGSPGISFRRSPRATSSPCSTGRFPLTG